MENVSCIIIGDFNDEYKLHRSYQRLLLGVVFIALGSLLFFEFQDYTSVLLTIVFVCIFFILLFGSMLDINNVKSYVNEGNIIFNENTILVQQREYSKENIKKIICDIWDYTPRRGRGVHTINSDNTLTITTSEGEEFQYNFYVENKDKYLEIEKKMHGYKTKGIAVFIMS